MNPRRATTFLKRGLSWFPFWQIAEQFDNDVSGLEERRAHYQHMRMLQDHRQVGRRRLHRRMARSSLRLNRQLNRERI